MFHDLGQRVDLSRRGAAGGGTAASVAVDHQGHHVSVTSRLRTSLLPALLVVLGLVVSACGGSKADANDDPTTSAPTSATPTPTPTPSPTAEPLSPFEGKAPVKALRNWAAAATQDVNARHRDFPLARRFEVDTDKVRNDVSTTWHEDFDKYFPGPLPFTPIAVSGSGGRATITTCAVASGFSLTRPGGKPAEKHRVIPVVFTMARQQGSWLLAGIVAGTADCSGVKIQEVPW